ncbi:hypothetical protein ABI59_10145 [Acidobacteria bacterium Mor1]|nr:hypothetical protein ABI59_10145 [Acidobacteria bacterium Mor1]
MTTGLTFLCAALLAGAALADVDDKPLDLGTTEQTAVRLVLMDVVVVDRQGNTVEGLELDDFEATYRGNLARIDTLDVDCSAGSLADPKAIGLQAKREPLPVPENGRRTVMLFDYMHLSMLSRANSLKHAERTINEMQGERDEIMLVALTGGLRIEHSFSNDRNSLLAAIDRMRHDVSLWNGNFSHLNESGFVTAMKGLMSALEAVPGRKSLVMFSSMQDVPLDFEFEEIAAMAANSRCSIYPIDSRGMFLPNGMFTATSLESSGAGGG